MEKVQEIKTYKDLLIWQRGIQLCKEIYALAAHFPDDEKFGSILQMKRASVSIPSNISEQYKMLNALIKSIKEKINA